MEKAASEKNELVIAIAGNPNCGKTVIFNSLTGARQHVGNWPGVTVEIKEGSLDYNGKNIKVVDLPGTYSLGAYSEDEVIARDYILSGKPDVVINVIDSTNLERNLFLTCQLLEMGARVIIALNMYDEAKARNMDIDIDRMSVLLGVPVIPTVAVKNRGISELVQLAEEAADKPLKNVPGISCGMDMDTDMGEAEDIEAVITEKRYGYISGIVREVLKRNGPVDEKQSISDRIDRVVTNRVLGIPIFLLAMWGVFQFTFALGTPLVDLIDSFFGWSGTQLGSFLEAAGAPRLLQSLLVDGIIGGVGSVMVFMPNILLLFFAISLLEDSGYMARAAFITDRFMHILGLHGKSFIPMIVGFGCNVPGILATRTLDNKRDRLVTILINPLMSCSARLPVYILFTGAFFSARQGLIIFFLYLLGIMLAVLMGVIFKKLIFKGVTSHFVMELPPYRVPALKSTFIHMWDRGSAFVRKAGSIIFSVVVLVWVLSSLPAGVEYASPDSLLGRIGGMIAPLFGPTGFGTWEASVALLFGIVAKEVVVGTLGTVYGAGEEGLAAVLARTWTPLSAISFMVMTLLYIPCAATIGAIKRETGSWGWTGFAIGYSLVLGWIMAVIVYQAGRLLGYA